MSNDSQTTFRPIKVAIEYSAEQDHIVLGRYRDSGRPYLGLSCCIGTKSQCEFEARMRTDQYIVYKAIPIETINEELMKDELPTA